MELVAAMPFDEAVQKLGERSVVASTLNSAQWAEVPVALRERAFFSARVENARFLQRAKDSLGDYVAGARDPATGALRTGSREAFVQQMQRFALSEGMGPLKPGDKGSLKDITSNARLGLVFDVITKSSRDYANWKQGMDPAVLDEFPAQRFIRVRRVKKPRPYHQRAIGTVRLKTDLTFWLSLNPDFGVPWGPWGFGSGCDVEDVDRAATEKLGLLRRNEPVKPVAKDFNEGLQASVAHLDPDILQALAQSLDGKAVLDGDVLRWQDRTRPPVTPPEPLPATSPAPTTGPAEALAQPAPPKLDQIDKLVRDTKLENKPSATALDMEKFLNAMQEKSPVSASSMTASYLDARMAPGSFAPQSEVQSIMQELLNYVPPATAAALPPIRFEVYDLIPNLPHYMGGYNPAKRKMLLAMDHILNSADPAATLRETIFHEMGHWLELHDAKAGYRADIHTHYDARTAPGQPGSDLAPLSAWEPEWIVRPDEWFTRYAGMERYINPTTGAITNYTPGGEIVSNYAEVLSYPKQRIADLWNNPKFRETILKTWSIFFSR